MTQFIGDTASLCRSWYCRDWLLSGVLTLQTAQPYTINSALDDNQDGNATDRPNQTTGLAPAVSGRAKWFALTPEQIALLLPAEGQNGAVGRNTFRGWGLYGLDLALSRRIAHIKSGSLLLRAEAFNVFNHPDLGIPIRILESPVFGHASGTVAPPRILQLALKYQF